MTPPILARVAQLHGSSEDVDCNTISTATSWEYVSKSSSLSDLTRFGAAFSSSSSKNNHLNHNHEIAQSSAISSSHLQNNQNGGHRGFLPHGIVHLPPSHRNYSHHLNGFNGYRLTQKDLLQPQQTSSENNGIVPFSGSPTTYTPSKDDSNPVMRSTSFNLDTSSARRYNFKFRQQNTPTPPPGQLNQQQQNKGPSKKPQQKGFVFLAENPENGACDVYNVPFQSDIYSMPVDSIATSSPAKNNKKVGRSNSICTSKFTSANFTAKNIPITNPLPPPPPTTSTATKASSISHRENHNQNQRLKSSEPVITASSSSVSNNCTKNSNGDATPPPPQRKNNLNRRKSREEDTSGIALETCNIRCPPAPPPAAQPRESSKKHHAPQPPTQHLDEPGRMATLDCKPPQRWSSLAAVQPSSSSTSSSSPPKKDIPPVIPEPASSSAAPAAVKQSGVNYSTATKPPPPPPHHHQLTSTYSTNNAFPTESTAAKLTSEKSSHNLSSSNHCSSSNNLVVGKTLNIVAKAVESSCLNKVSSSCTGASSKKPRSRSVDPSAASADNSEPSHHRQSIKCSGTPTTNANQRTSSVNISYTDNPNNHPLPPEPVESSPLSIFHGSSNKDSTADRRNPLGLSFLNLFRRNKSGGGGSSSANGAATNGKLPNSHPNSDCEFTSLVPEKEENSSSTPAAGVTNAVSSVNINNNKEDTSYYFRELPPPPPGEHSEESGSEGQGSPTTSPMECRDFAASIERVKDCGWYWGPLSSEHAEDLLKNEPDGSFIVRDSSDARYIFSLTFKLHGLVRHVRIEHDQGNFSFGPLTRFKAATIVDFVEKAVAHSRSGRYLFFLHRRPVLGPMQVQLLHPYSRFMHPRSLKHMCRFVILKYVRRDLIHTLPLPKPLQDYLNTPHYYFEPPDRVIGGVGGSSSSGAIDGVATHNNTNIRNANGGVSGSGGNRQPTATPAATATISRMV